jgi:cytidylate kinase
MKPVVAIDGPAGSGKGTLARMIASHFNFVYLDTGLLYRTVAFLNVSLEKIKNMKIEDLLSVADQLTDEQLRSSENSTRASNIAKMPEIRDIMTRLQRDFIDLYSDKGVVLDGRDIGTVIVPDACCKLFITADLEERAKRRFADLNGKNTTFEEVFDNMKRRDAQDKSRKVAPLTCDETYIVVDTTRQSAQESFQICKEEVKKAFVNSEYKSFV